MCAGAGHGLAIDTQADLGGRRFADAPEVDEIYERAVVLAISAAECGGVTATLLAEPIASEIQLSR